MNRMDRDATMKTAISIGMVALSALAAGCGNNNSSANSPGDLQIRQKVVGTWKLDSDPTNSIAFNADGTFSSTIGPSQGTWSVSNGIFIAVENGPDGDNETGKVVRIDDHEWVLQEAGGTDLTKLHRQ